MSKGTGKPYVSFLGAASTGVTQSCHLVRFQKYVILLDCGLYQESDIVTNYKRNQELLKKIKPREIDWIILHEIHADHTCLVPALYAKGCQAHILVPEGTTEFLRVLWQDSCKIMAQDAMKIQHKHGIKASPFYAPENIERALSRCIEIPRLKKHNLCENIALTYYPSNHIIHACQISLELKQGYEKKVLNFTGDIGNEIPQPYIEPRQDLPFGDVLISEGTYNEPKRQNKAYDRQKDLDKIACVINENKKIIIPVFALGRCQTMLTELYHMWDEEKIPRDVKIYVDSPLAQRFCRLYPDLPQWDFIMNKWNNLHFVKDYEETLSLQASNEPFVLLASAGMLTGGKIVSWVKKFLPDRNAHILFCGYCSENSLGRQIRSKQKEVKIEGELVQNNINITELMSFSSHCSYEELMDYLCKLRYNKVAIVHSDYEHKPEFCRVLQERLCSQNKSSRVICVNDNTKIFI